MRQHALRTRNPAAERTDVKRVNTRAALETCRIGKEAGGSQLQISRMIVGLWQVADMERMSGAPLELESSADAMLEYVDAGFTTFDMADHYGSAELITGRCLEKLSERAASAKMEDAVSMSDKPQPMQVFTKWCPKPAKMDAATVRAGVQERLQRLGVAKLDLLQFHWWQYEHLAYVDAAHELAALQSEGLIEHIGLTNFDTDHLRVVEGCGACVATNQVCFSLLDRRPAGDMSRYCIEHDVKLLCYGSLAGGFLTNEWHGKPPPSKEQIEQFTWSQAKYFRFIQGIGGWIVFQGILEAAARVAHKHSVSLANVATKWVLDHPAVAAVIVGARLGHSEHRADNARVFSFELDAADHAVLDEALSVARSLPGDCGDEYRRPPFLTASGDLSHHIEALPQYFTAMDMETTGAMTKRNGERVCSGSVSETLAGFSLAVRRGQHVFVGGMTATHGQVSVCPGDAHGQATFILDKILAAISALGGSRNDVVRTRIFVTDVDSWEGVARTHGRYFAEVLPANTLVVVSGLAGPYNVEIEAEALLCDCDRDGK